jgi:hypothetical protein
VLPELELPAGRYRVEVVPAGAAPRVDVRCNGVSMPRVTEPSASVFELDGKRAVSIAVAPAAKKRRSFVSEVTLVAAPEAPGALRCLPAGRPLVVPLALVSEPKNRKNLASHPDHLSFTAEGLVLAADPVPAVNGVELTLSRGGGYLVELRRDGALLWQTNIEKRNDKRRTLETHRFALPQRLEGSGRYELSVKPLRPGPAALGHALLF